MRRGIDRLPVSERWKKRHLAHACQGTFAEMTSRRVLGRHPKVFYVARGIYSKEEFHSCGAVIAPLRSARIGDVVVVMSGYDDGLWGNEITFPRDFRFFLIGEYSETRFSIDISKDDRAIHYSVGFSMIVHGRNEARPIQTTNDFLSQFFRVWSTAVCVKAGGLSVRHNMTKKPNSPRALAFSN